MSKGNLIPMPEEVARKNRKWNQGYHDGYSGSGPAETEGVYITAFYVGQEDRFGDDLALVTGEFDHLSESEKEFLFGREEKASEYRSTD